jgi:hypothetical protein
MGTTDRLRAGFRHAKMPDLARRNQILDCAGDIFHWRLRIHAMLVIEVDIVGLQPLEGAFDHLADMVRPADGLAGKAAAVLDVETELGCDHHLVAHGAQGFSDKFFVVIGSIDLGGVKEGHTAIEGGPDQGNGLAPIHRGTIGGAHAHASKADGGNFKSLAKRSRFHTVLLLLV